MVDLLNPIGSPPTLSIGIIDNLTPRIYLIANPRLDLVASLWQFNLLSMLDHPNQAH